MESCCNWCAWVTSGLEGKLGSSPLLLSSRDPFLVLGSRSENSQETRVVGVHCSNMGTDVDWRSDLSADYEVASALSQLLAGSMTFQSLERDSFLLCPTSVDTTASKVRQLWAEMGQP